MIWMFSMAEDPSDREFLEALYEKHKQTMYQTAQRYVIIEQDQMDVVQSSIEALIKKVALLRQLDENAQAGYILTTVRHQAFNSNKREKLRRDRIVSMDPDWFRNDYLIEDLVNQLDDIDALKRIWQSLSEDERHLLASKYILELPNMDIAKSMDCKPNSVRMKLTRARRHAKMIATDGKECDPDDPA